LLSITFHCGSRAAVDGQLDDDAEGLVIGSGGNASDAFLVVEGLQREAELRVFQEGWWKV
jgi:NAD(P)H-hydrate repair Nnr-like enzyme with NAD(P)H-hydrate epimerase domain